MIYKGKLEICSKLIEDTVISINLRVNGLFYIIKVIYLILVLRDIKPVRTTLTPVYTKRIVFKFLTFF